MAPQRATCCWSKSLNWCFSTPIINLAADTKLGDAVNSLIHKRNDWMDSGSTDGTAFRRKTSQFSAWRYLYVSRSYGLKDLIDHRIRTGFTWWKKAGGRHPKDVSDEVFLIEKYQKNLILEDLSEFLDYTQSWSLIKSEFRYTQRARQITTNMESWING